MAAPPAPAAVTVVIPGPEEDAPLTVAVAGFCETNPVWVEFERYRAVPSAYVPMTEIGIGLPTPCRLREVG
jgi:hypothetical protein